MLSVVDVDGDDLQDEPARYVTIVKHAKKKITRLK